MIYFNLLTGGIKEFTLITLHKVPNNILHKYLRDSHEPLSEFSEGLRETFKLSDRSCFQVDKHPKNQLICQHKLLSLHLKNDQIPIIM